MRRDKLIDEWFTASQALQRAWKAQFYAELKDEELSIGQLALLFYLQENQPASGKQIAADTHNSKSAVAQQVDSLDRLQLIVRHEDPADRRVTYIALSRKGVDKTHSLQAKRKEFHLRLAAALSDDDLSIMTGIQRKMLAELPVATKTHTSKKGE